MIPMMALVLVLQTTPPADPAAIPTLKMNVIDRCSPQSINDAVNCISQALDDDELQDLGQPAGRAYRPAFEQLITAKWKLDDPTSPVALDLKKKNVYNPKAAASILIADMTARLGARRFDYFRLAKEMSEKGANAPVAAAPPPKPQVAAGLLPIKECQRPTDAANLIITACTRTADGTLSRTIATPVAAQVRAPGALPEGIPAGSIEVPLEQCKSSTPLPPGIILKACYKLPDGRLARQAVRDPNAPKN